MRVAAVDCGTNSIRLLVADVDPAAGTLRDVTRTMQVVRLGQGVDRTGRFAPEAIERTLAATRGYAAECARRGVQRVRFVATSATRDAANRDEFVTGVRGIIGVEPEVIPGTEEAQLSFAGATRELAAERAPFLVVDLGGGSTEFVLGGATLEASRSVDIGCVRMTERHFAASASAGDPPSAAELAAATADVEAAIDAAAAEVPLARARALVGVAGTVTTITAHALRLPAYDPARIHGAELPVDAVLAACADLIGLPRAERAALPFMHPGRVDVIGAGALIWSRVVSRVAAVAGITRVTTSEHDILDGIAWSLAE